MRSLWHRLAHLTGWYYGNVVTFWAGDKLLAAFECDYCGDYMGLHETPFTRGRP